MRQIPSLELVLLASIWGASFLFMRVGSPEFGPILFTALRTLIASLFLIFCMVCYKQLAELKHNKLKLLIVGLLNTAIPFVLFGYATLTLTAGTTSILNATVPMFGALIAYIWLKDKLSLSSTIGLFIGFLGVYFLMKDTNSQQSSTILPTIAALSAAMCYGISANFTKRYLSNVKPLTLATGSQIYATLFLLPISFAFWPDKTPSINATYSVLFLGIICTGVAYILFFRLISALGPAKAISVTYLIPAFGILWGYIFLEERITADMLIGCSVILLGVALTTGVLFKTKVGLKFQNKKNV